MSFIPWTLTMKLHFTVIITLSFLSFSSGYVLADEKDSNHTSENDDLPHVELITVKDLSSLASQARQTDKIIMLEVTASYCSYCTLLEEEIIKPMLRSGDYKETVLIRQLEVDGSYTVKDIDGNETTPAMLSRAYKVNLTPTILFLDADGNEVAERILGVYSLDFFGAYVDEALAKGLKTISTNKALHQ